jgi:hypothetical protein
VTELSGESGLHDEHGRQAAIAERGRVPPTWGSLPRRAKAFRIAHLAWGIAALRALAHIWTCAIMRRRDRHLWASVAFLLVQGAALVIGRGDCPFGPFQRRLGDPVPMFELLLPPRAAKAAIPVLLLVTVAGMVAVVLRPPRTGAYPWMARRHPAGDSSGPGASSAKSGRGPTGSPICSTATR